MPGRVLTTYGRPMAKAIYKVCEGSEKDCENVPMELGKLYRVKAVYQADPSKVRKETVEYAVVEAIKQLRQEYPNVNVSYIQVVDPTGDGSTLEITMEVFDPQPGRLVGFLAVVWLIIRIAILLVALGILVAALKFFIHIVLTPGKVLLEEFIDTVSELIFPSETPEEKEEAERKTRVLILAAGAIVIGAIAYGLYRRMRGG